MRAMDQVGYPWRIKRGSSTLELTRPVVVAPMAGAYDPPYRMVLHQLGLELSFTEMISARAVHEGSNRTRSISDWVPEEGYSCAQIFGADPIYLSTAARRMERMGHSMIDLNAGCPKRKVTGTGAGSALLRAPSVFLRCICSILDSVKVPVGTKIRSGYSEYDDNLLRVLVKDLQGAGISYIAVHPRTGKQQYTGKVDRKLIGKVRSWVDIPILASGDVKGPEDVEQYLDLGASSVMFARGALGDPLWFGRTLTCLNGDKEWVKDPAGGQDGLKEHLSLVRDHLENACEWYGEKRGCIEFRKHLVWYMKWFRKRGPFRERAYSINTKNDALSLICDLETEWARDLQMNLY
ncbi:MAG: tRNA-dihydrouridine synthase [Thermoplasmatota archaeon]